MNVRSASSHYFYAGPHNVSEDHERVTESVFASVGIAFEEDRRIIEAQQKVLDSDENIVMRPIAADAALGRFRSLVSRMAEAERRRTLPAPVAAQAQAG